MTPKDHDTTESPLSTGREWTAVLDGDIADRARETIYDIVDTFRDEDMTESEDPSLSGGLAGTALLFAALAEIASSEADAEIAVGCIERAVDAAAEFQYPPFFGGVAGVAWAVQHLAGRLFDSEGLDELFDSVDASLLDLLESPSWEADYDLISGLVGYGVYLLDRPQNDVVAAALVRIIDHLDVLAEVGESDQITWLTPPQLLPEWQRELAPDGYHNVGLAHGVPGVVAFLGLAHRAGVEQDRTRRLLDGAVRWVLAQELDQSTHAFSSWVIPGADDRTPSRLAWCYGHLGLALALLVAARSISSKDWEDRALAILKAAAKRSFDDSGVKDTGLCHGAAGVAHLFNRAFQATGDEALGEAARRWYEQTLTMRMPDIGVAGFPAFRIDPESHEEIFEPTPGLLEGATGVALALLSAVHPLEPRWDRFMLVS